MNEDRLRASLIMYTLDVVCPPSLVDSQGLVSLAVAERDWDVHPGCISSFCYLIESLAVVLMHIFTFHYVSY